MKPDKLKCGKGYDNCLRCPYLGECSIYDFNKLCDEWEKHHDEVVADLKEDISCAKGTIDYQKNQQAEVEAENAKLKMSTSFNCSSCTTVKENAKLKERLIEE